ncbi:phage tail tape measure protein [Actinophytocola sediminis]
MSLVVGEIMAKIGADRSGFTRETKAAEAEHKSMVKAVEGTTPKVDADTSKASDKLKGVGDAAKDAAKEMNSAFSTAWVGISADLDKIEQDAWASGRTMDKAFTSSLAAIRSEMERVQQEATETGATIDSELGEALRGLKAQAAGLGQETGASLMDGIGIAGKLSAAITGGLLGQGLMSGLEKAWEEDRVGSLIVASTPAAGSAAGKMGDVAGSLFADNFGESIEDAGRAITAVFQNRLIDTSEPEAAIERISAKVMTVSTIVEEEFNAVARSAQQAVRTGLADNVDQAMDMIVHATQQGLNTTGELLDTITEYGTTFRVMGLEGADAFGLMQQAQRAGARNIDIAADAVKEFGILTQDTASAAGRGFASIGLDGAKMSKMIAAGGDTAKDALRQTLNALQQMPPSLERNQAAVDLFGTKAEDLGEALFSMDLDDAALQFGDFAGSVTEAAQQMDEGVTFTDRLGRGISALGTKVGEFLDAIGGDSGLEEFTTQFRALTLAQERALSTGDMSGLDEIREKYEWLAPAVDEWIEKNHDAVDATGASADANVELGDTIDQLLEKQRTAADGVVSLSEAHIRNQQAIADANAAAQEFAGQGLNNTKTGFDLTTEAGQEMQGALNDVVGTTHETIAAMREQNATSAEVNEYINSQRKTFIQLATDMGISDSAARALADSMVGIPVPNIRVKDHATSAMIAIQKRLDALPITKTTDWYFTTHYRTQGASRPEHLSSTWQGVGGLASGAVMKYFAAGGIQPMSASNAAIVQPHTRTGVIRAIGDNPIADELFMPLEPNNKRSQDLLDEGIKRMRPGLAQMLGLASGGIVGGAWGAGQVVGMPSAATVTAREGHTFNISGPDADEVARRVIDQLDAREALHG